MSVSRLPSGRYRSQTYNPETGRYVSSAKILGLSESTFPTERKARAADIDAAKLLADRKPSVLTLSAWAETWTTDPLYRRPKESTAIHNRERIKKFVEQHGDLPLDAIGDQTVAKWIAGGLNLSTVPVLKAMFNDAASAKAGRLIIANPWTGLGLEKSKGRGEETPPSEDEIRVMLEHAHRVTAPGFAAWLETAVWTGFRPGELDALGRGSIDFAANRAEIVEQWNVKTRSFTLPKNGKTRTGIVIPQARAAILGAQNTSGFCFVNLRGNHWTPSARSHHWDRVRALMGWLDRDSRKTLYLATRHFAGWYMYNVLELPAEDVAIQLGHEDHGALVRSTYGHRDRARALGRVEDAFAARALRDGRESGLRIVKGETA